MEILTACYACAQRWAPPKSNSVVQGPPGPPGAPTGAPGSTALSAYQERGAMVNCHCFVHLWRSNCSRYDQTEHLWRFDSWDTFAILQFSGDRSWSSADQGESVVSSDGNDQDTPPTADHGITRVSIFSLEPQHQVGLKFLALAAVNIRNSKLVGPSLVQRLWAARDWASTGASFEW